MWSGLCGGYYVRECDAAVDARLGAARQSWWGSMLRMGTGTVTGTEGTEADGGAKTNKAQLTGDMARRERCKIWADLCSVS